MQRDALVKRVMTPEKQAKLQQRLTQEQSLTPNKLIMDLDSQVEPSKKELAGIKQVQALRNWKEIKENVSIPDHQQRKIYWDFVNSTFRKQGI